MTKVIDAKAIGSYLKQLRGARTQLEVASAIGVTTMAISQYEAGERIPKDEIKIKLANYYDRTVEQLFFSQK